MMNISLAEIMEIADRANSNSAQSAFSARDNYDWLFLLAVL